MDGWMENSARSGSHHRIIVFTFLRPYRKTEIVPHSTRNIRRADFCLKPRLILAKIDTQNCCTINILSLLLFFWPTTDSIRLLMNANMDDSKSFDSFVLVCCFAEKSNKILPQSLMRWHRALMHEVCDETAHQRRCYKNMHSWNKVLKFTRVACNAFYPFLEV